MRYNQGKIVTGVLKFAAIAIIGTALLSSCNQKPKQESGSTNASQPGAVAGNGYSDSSSSSVRVFDQNGRVCIQQSNTSYEVVNIIEGAGKIPLLLKIRKTELCYADSVNHDKMYEISAKSVMDTKAVSWDASFVATDISFKDNTLLAVKEGNDNEHDFIRRFSLQNGGEVFSCSFSDLEVKIPNVINKYFIGYTSKKAATDPLSRLKVENLLGVVRLGSSTSAIDSFKVKLKRSKVVDKISGSVPDAILVAANDNTRAIDDGKTIILMKGDAHTQNKDVSDFAVKFTYYFGDDNESTDVTVPVVNGKFDLAHVQYDKDIFEIVAF
jgi:hypothetical protein